MYAVFDLETTGLATRLHDRVVEVAVVQVAETGEVTDEWVTLVNPGRDLGPQHIHGIRAADILPAPLFDQVAGHLLTLLQGRIPVAHNLAFDVRFLTAEYARLGITIPLDVSAGLCTMSLAGDFLPGASRSLHGCTSAAGIALDNAHSALCDARATAALLAHYLTLTGHPPTWWELGSRAKTAPWPTLPYAVVAPVTRRPDGYVEEHFLARLVDRLPRIPEPIQADSYLDLLDRALIDRHISVTEGTALVDHARDLGLSRPIVEKLHADYLRALAHIAWQDGVVTPEEQDDLERVADLLGLPRASVPEALAAAQSAPPVDAAPQTSVGAFRLEPGDIIVLTGQMELPREAWCARARAAGLDARDGNVTKATKLVVAADPDSLSGKARKARDYGIPVITEAAFATFLDGLCLNQTHASDSQI